MPSMRYLPTSTSLTTNVSGVIALLGVLITVNECTTFFPDEVLLLLLFVLFLALGTLT
jgi:hypothetical protein